MNFNDPAGLGRRNVQRHLAGLQRQQIVVARDQVAGLDQQL